MFCPATANDLSGMACGVSRSVRSSTCGQALPTWTWLADWRVTSATSAESVWCAQIAENQWTTVLQHSAVCTSCSHWNWLSAIPYNSALQLSRQQLINAWTSVLAASRVNNCTLHNTTELMQLIIARPVDGSDLLSHRKSIVKNDTKVANAEKRPQIRWLKLNISNVDLLIHSHFISCVTRSVLKSLLESVFLHLVTAVPAACLNNCMLGFSACYQYPLHISQCHCLKEYNHGIKDNEGCRAVTVLKSKPKTLVFCAKPNRNRTENGIVEP